MLCIARRYRESFVIEFEDGTLILCQVTQVDGRPALWFPFPSEVDVGMIQGEGGSGVLSVDDGRVVLALDRAGESAVRVAVESPDDVAIWRTELWLVQLSNEDGAGFADTCREHDLDPHDVRSWDIDQQLAFFEAWSSLEVEP